MIDEEAATLSVTKSPSPFPRTRAPAQTCVYVAVGDVERNDKIMAELLNDLAAQMRKDFFSLKDALSPPNNTRKAKWQVATT